MSSLLVTMFVGIKLFVYSVKIIFIIQMLISLPIPLVAIQTKGHCNVYSKYLLSQCCASIALHLKVYKITSNR